MQDLIELVLRAGRVAVDVSLYTLLPIMVVMMVLMRFLETYGVIDRLIALLAPILKPFGLTGLSAVALIQTSLVSFIAPLPTLARMERQGTPERQVAATLAAVLVVTPANAIFPMAAYGVNTGGNLLISIAGGLVAASCCYYGFGRRLAASGSDAAAAEGKATQVASFLKTIEASGVEAISIVIRVIPMLLISLVFVYGMQDMGMFAMLAGWLRPILSSAGLSPEIVTPAITNYLAGSTALLGFYHQVAQEKPMPGVLLDNATIGFLVHSLNLVTIAILLSTGPKIARSTPPAIAGAMVGIAVRIGLGTVI
ncbi:hypothetical protein AC244_27145 [Ensifer adhaerens]|uniref:Nucleoside transporter/FeoB GTPase Gate domain-containing protein n=1 Tax=Ensifer adhaerens TaxID=106592 RepID=A0A0L8BIE0_ENSAD|nr:nucleoside recognition domain-containing protein [Ensifer adhaerens]KOF14325.1 hypothetical protein AC244_27145 [Ensifer adhaerens]